MKLNKAFAIKLSKLLNERKISKYRLEKLTGLTHSTIRNIFNELNSDVRFSTIVKIAQALEIELSKLFDDKIFELSNLDAD